VNTDFSATPGEGDIFDDPLFEDTSSYNFRLQAGSPAIDKAIELGYTLDMDGNPVPSGDAPDMGAFEYAGNTSIGFSQNPGSHNSFYESPKTYIGVLRVYALSGRLIWKSTENLSGSYKEGINLKTGYCLKNALPSGRYIFITKGGK